jgi:hypothetical protein
MIAFIGPGNYSYGTSGIRLIYRKKPSMNKLADTGINID